MRYILIIIIALLLIGCTPVIQADTIPETVIVTHEVTVEKIVTIEDNTKIIELQNELKQYKTLISNINELLGNVYYMEVSNSNYSSEGIGFSLKYKDKYYLITAGHGVHYVEGEWDIIYTNFKAKANFSNEWIFPKLLDYNDDYLNKNDYAIFYSDKIDNGFIIDNDKDNPEYVLGYDDINIAKDYNKNNISGESGSPIIDHDGETVGMVISESPYYYTNIDTIKKAIDSIK